MTQPTTVLPGGAPPPASPRGGLDRGQRVAVALVALLVGSGAFLFLTRDHPDAEPVPRTTTHAALVREAGAACAVVARTGYSQAQLLVLRERLGRLVPPPADAARWRAALAAVDRAAGVEGQAVKARNDPAALKAIAPRQVQARADAIATFSALGVTSCLG